MRAGAPVPPGFVLLAGAFDVFLQETDLKKEIDAIVEIVDYQKMRTVEVASKRIRALVEGKDIPAFIAREVEEQFRSLGAKYVAVRSSAIEEDGVKYAWAGQLDSFLNTSEADLMHNIRKCWSSFFTPRAMCYRFESGSHKEGLSMAVVVQQMIQSEVSGVAFSVHPVTQDKNQLVIEAGYGLGEAVVSGQITPDSYVVDKKKFVILDKNINIQNRKMVRSLRGNKWISGGMKKGRSQKLSDVNILDLVKLTMHIERYYKAPVDIEWSLCDGSLYITQSRPITTLSRGQLKSGDTQLPIIHKAEFWARESSMPLFWLTDIQYDLGSASLFFFKKNMYHCYYLNDSQVVREIKGYKYFSRQANRRQYLKRAEKIAKHSEKTFKRVRELDLRKTSDEKLKQIFTALIKQIEKFVSMYTETEEVSMRRFEGTKFNRRDFEKIGKMRLRLRQCSSDLFFVYIGKLLGEVARRRGVSLTREVFFYSFDELYDLVSFGKKMATKTILERSRGFAVLREDKNVRMFIKKDADALWKQVKRLVSQKDKNTISGSVAFPGKVRGRVKVIFQKRSNSIGDYGVKKSEILVTDMTKPDMIPACRKAKGIITDEGGIMCHAAIIAREYKKPCIVGTKLATQLLKSGDVVEVDANIGVVKVIIKYGRK